MNIGEINEQIRIEDFLANEGIFPEVRKKNGVELWYRSPLRNENTPSFKVHTEKNVWFDYGSGTGGKLIELYRLLKNNNDIKEIVFYFNNEYKGGVNPKVETSFRVPTKKEDTGGVILKEIYPIENKKLFDYLRSRRIDFDIAKEFLTEVHYMFNGKYYYALGFRCDNAGYELRSCINKRNINGKNITTVKNNSDKVKMFEGNFDFLSYLSEHKDTYKDYDYIVLNTASFVDGMYSSLNRLEKNYLYQNLVKYDRIDVYFDNDDKGREITGLMNEIFEGVNNFSILFEKYEDYNLYCIKGREDGVFTPEENDIKIHHTKKRESNVNEEKPKGELGKYSIFNL